MSKPDYKYLICILDIRKTWLHNEIKRLLFDKTSSLSTIKTYETEMVLIDEQKKILKDTV